MTASLSPGAVLSGKWRVDRLIGEGGMASVYAGVHVRNGLGVAIKVLHPEVARQEDPRRRFLQEGYVANKVGHPGVVRVLDDGVDGEHVYLVMELLAGKSLWDVWEANGSRLPAERVEPIVAAVLEVLAAAHAAGVVHRDLKPDNVFLTSEGGIKLLDFGIARLREPRASEFATSAGDLMGTPAFMPAEQALGKWAEVDARADLYAVGASAFMLLSGRTVHVAETLPQLLVATATRPAPPLRSVAPDVPEGLAQIVDRALAFSAHDRWPSAEAMLAALRATRPGAGAVARAGSSGLDGWESAPTVAALLASTPMRSTGNAKPWLTSAAPAASASDDRLTMRHVAGASTFTSPTASTLAPSAELAPRRSPSGYVLAASVLVVGALASGVAAWAAHAWGTPRGGAEGEHAASSAPSAPSSSVAAPTPSVAPVVEATAPSVAAPPPPVSASASASASAPKPPPRGTSGPAWVTVEDCQVGFDGTRRCTSRRVPR